MLSILLLPERLSRPCIHVPVLPLVRRRAWLQGVLAIGILPVVGGALAQPGGPTSSAWLHRASRLGALAQRMAKAYMELHLKVQPDDAKAALAASQRLVQASLDDMGKVQWPTDIAAHQAQVRKLAEALDHLTQVAPTREGCVAVTAQADQMLAATEVLFHGLERLGKTVMHPLVQASAGLRMRSQRLAKNYFLQAVGQDVSPLREQRQADLDECKRILSTLGTALVSNTSVRAELSAADMQWVFFEACFGRDPDIRGMRAMASASGRLLEIADNLTVQYEVALKDQRNSGVLPAP